MPAGEEAEIATLQARLRVLTAAALAEAALAPASRLPTLNVDVQSYTINFLKTKLPFGRQGE